MRLLPFVVLLCFAGCTNPSTTTNVAPASIDFGQALDATVGGIQLERKAFIDGRLTMLIPSNFAPMDEEMLRLKYPSERRPTVVYTNTRGSVNIAANYTNDSMTQSDLPEFHDTMKKMFNNLYPSATWYESGVTSINGREWLTLDLRTPTIDTEVRNLMAGTSSEGRLLLVTFNTVIALEPTWLEAGKAIIQSLRLDEESTEDER